VDTAVDFAATPSALRFSRALRIGAMNKRLWWFSAGTLRASLIVACIAHGAAAQPLTLHYGQDWSSAHSIFSLPISVAQREGLFQHEGLNVQVIIPVPGGSDKMVFDGLNKGWLDVTHIATPFLIRAAMSGADAVAINAEFRSAIYSLVAKPNIKSYANLKGKLIGLADEQGTITLSMRRLLAKHGLARGSFGVKTEEGTPQRFYCLLHSDCDATVLGQPQDLQALAQGYSLLGHSDEVLPDFLYTVTAARRPWAQAHREAVVRYVRAMADAFRFIRDPANRSKVVADIAATIGCSDATAGQTLDLFNEPGRDVLPRRGEIDFKGLQQVIAMMAEAGLLKQPLPQAERFVDLQYLQAAGVQ
jgi:ABC-type nitrate/sulfonate/bicarbonate transport system substrate-binding protein